MTYLFENPLPTVLVLVVIAAFLMFVFMQTGKKVFILLAVLTAALVATVFLLERLVVTDFEEVENTLQQIAVDLEANDVSKVLDHLSEDATFKSQVESTLNRFTVKKASIKRNLKITFSGDRTMATATFNAVGTIDDASGQFRNQPVPRYFEVKLVNEGDRWLVMEYEDSEPLKGL